MIQDKFEEGFIYRIGRALPLMIAALCVVSLLAAGAVVGYSFVPVSPMAAPKPAALAPEVAVSAEQVGARVDQAEGQDAAKALTSDQRSDSTNAIDSEVPTEAALSVARAIHGLVALVPGGIWKSIEEVRCTQRYYRICITRERFLVREGLSDSIEPVLALYDVAGTESIETKILEFGASYPVNESNAAKKVKVLNEARDILAGQPEAQRLKYLRAWALLRGERERERQQADQAERERVAREQAKEEARIAAEATKKQSARATAISAFGVALAALWFVALALALLAIERHLRVLSKPGVPKDA